MKECSIHFYAHDLNAKARGRILDGRKFEDDIRLYAGDEEISIEIENDGNRLEFDILKMLSFAEAVPKKHRAYGCLVIPANKTLSNPYISGSGKERIWDYVTRRLLPMILPVHGVRLDNILVLEIRAPESIRCARVSGYVSRCRTKGKTACGD